MPLRIGLITDIHHGPDVDVRLGSAAPELLEKFTRRMRNDFHPDLIVDLGDRINDTDLDADKRRLGDVRRMLEAAGCRSFMPGAITTSSTFLRPRRARSWARRPTTSRTRSAIITS